MRPTWSCVEFGCSKNMRLKAALQGNLKEYLKSEYKVAQKAVSLGTWEAGEGLKKAMRAQVVRVGLGQRLANTWRGDKYPKRRFSLGAAGHVYTKAQHIMVGLEDGHVIRGKERRMLAIPTRNAPKRIWGKRVTPALYEQAKGPLTFITYRGKGLLVDTNLQAPYSRETGAFRKLRRIRKGASNPTNVRPKVMFWLVPQVRMPKKIDFKKDSKRWHSRIPVLVVKNWEILE